MGSRSSEKTDDEAGRGGPRWWLLLLVIPVVVLLVLQFQPDQPRGASPAPTGSVTTSAPDTSPPPRASPAVIPPPGRGDLAEGSVTTRALPHGLRRVTGRWSLFARSDRAVVQIDFGRHRLTTSTLPALQTSGPVSFIVTGAGAIVHPLDWSPGYLVPPERPAHELRGVLSRGGPLVPGPDPDHVWVDVGETGHGGSIRLIGVDGRPDGPVIPKPTNVRDWISSDGGGHPLLPTTGGTYAVGRNGLRRVTIGAVLASGPTGWLVDECDDRDVCAVKDIDRVTGQRTVLPRFPVTLADDLGRIGQAGRLSPDGRTAALVGSTGSGRAALWLTDLASGRSHRVAVGSLSRGYAVADSLAWSPDGRWLFVVGARGAVLVVDTRTREVRPLGIRLPAVRQLAVAPPP